MVEKNMSVRIGPFELLSELKMMLGEEGGIKGVDDLQQMISLMQESTKMVRHCTYLNILRATTDPTILQQFLDTSGWSILNDWLQEGRKEENHALLIELLHVYQHLPVTVDILKQNSCAKTIKQLIRIDNETIKTLANSIVESWMSIIKGRSESSSSDKSKKKTKKHHHHHHKSSTEVEHKKVPPLRIELPVRSPDNNSNDSVERTSEDSNVSTSNSTFVALPGAKTSKPKTVKTIPTRFRSTGLELENELPPTSKKKPIIAKDKLPIKRISKIPPSVQLEKRPRVQPIIADVTLSVTESAVASAITPPTVSTSPTENLGRIKLVPPKKPPMSELYDGSGFMDALANSVNTRIVRKKRRTSTPPSNQTSPPQKPPTPTSPPEKKPLIPSFYKETLDTSEDKEDESAATSQMSPEVENGSSPTQGSPQQDDDSNQDVEMKPENDHGSKSPSEASENVAMETEAEEQSSVSRKKKSVSWANEASLKTIFYFELNENERVNVNRVKDFAEFKREEQLLERRNFQSVRKLSNDMMEEKTAWRRPILICDLQPPMGIPGCNSTEKHLQRERELSVLQALYFTKEMVPDCPKEPEPDKYDISEPRIIPLDDVTGESGEVTHQDYPDPVQAENKLSSNPGQPPFTLPPEVAEILSNITTSTTTTSSASSHPSHSRHSEKGAPKGSQGGNVSLPAELNQMLSNLSSQGYNGTGIPPQIEGYLRNLQQTGKYSAEAVEQFRQMLQMMFNGQGSGAMPGPGMSPQGSMNAPPMIHGNALLGMPPPGFRPPLLNGPGPGLMGHGPRYGPNEEWNENMHNGPNYGRGRPGPGPPQGGRWRGPGPMGPRPGGPPSGLMGPGPGMMGGPPMGGPPMMMRGPPPNRNVCKYFMGPQGCRQGPGCQFLHPGVNGPPM